MTLHPTVDTTRMVLSTFVGLSFFAITVAILVATVIVLTRGIRAELAEERTYDRGGHVGAPAARPSFYNWQEDR